MEPENNHAERRFLFLQGPHGPFFRGLAARLRAAGADVWRIGFNAGDEALWPAQGFLPFRGRTDEWPDAVAHHMMTLGVTDIVCYGSSRPTHRMALEIARERGITRHVFEEGYLRPYWITYERGGTNASSPVMDLSLDQMADALEGKPALMTEAPDRWGDMTAHIFWGAVYHGLLLAGRHRYPDFKPHRSPNIGDEFRLYARRLALMPLSTVLRETVTARVRFGGFPYHLVLMQLAHDANFRDHGPFATQAQFLEQVFAGFAEGAPPHHHLVLKAHPLEDGREPLHPLIRRLTMKHRLHGRVHYISGGKLARLLATARSAVTVNSTAAEQVLWRGLPLKVFGHATYNRSPFVSNQPLAEFFKAPEPPDRKAYLIYRAFLLATSQIPGGYYAIRSRSKLLRQLPDLLLAPESPTERLLSARESVASLPHHLRVVT